MDKQKLLFLCTGNSARSLLGEYLLRAKAPDRFESFSAGSNPKDAPHPMTLRVLGEYFGIDASDARSKSWEEFGETHFDFVITVCDNARESCPVWPGQPVVAHWGSPDPAEFRGTEEETFRFFRDVGLQIGRRIDLLLALPMEKLRHLRTDLEEATRKIADQTPFES